MTDTQRVYVLTCVFVSGRGIFLVLSLRRRGEKRRGVGKTKTKWEIVANYGMCEAEDELDCVHMVVGVVLSVLCTEGKNMHIFGLVAVVELTVFSTHSPSSMALTYTCYHKLA